MYSFVCVSIPIYYIIETHQKRELQERKSSCSGMDPGAWRTLREKPSQATQKRPEILLQWP
jgi:hypothetical protein